jgi:potassium-transporting ATPase potassium-binding subunit
MVSLLAPHVDYEFLGSTSFHSVRRKQASLGVEHPALAGSGRNWPWPNSRTGGGFFNANGAHPYENPTPLTNFLEMLAIVLLPAAFTNTFSRMVGQPRQGWLLYGVMLLLFVCGLVFVHHFEQQGLPHIANLDSRHSRLQLGGNMEGKEVRFGIGGSTLTAVVTSNTATGSNNSMDDSYTSLGGMVLLVNMLLGELVFGGLGTGLYSMVMAAAIAVFLAGLMVGRTPEYLGKKIGPAENKMIMLYGLAAPLVVLPLTAIAVSTRLGLGRHCQRGVFTKSSWPFLYLRRYVV